MTFAFRRVRAAMFATTALWGVAGLTPVQAQTKPAPDGVAEIEEVVVVGSQIQALNAVVHASPGSKNYAYSLRVAVFCFREKI